MERHITEQEKEAFLEKTFQALSTIETKRQEAIKIAENLSRIEQGELLKLVEKIVPFMKEDPYEAEKLLTQAYKHYKVGGEVTAEFLWSHISVEDREVIKEKALQIKNRVLEHKKSIDHAKKEAVLVNQNVADIIEKLHLGKVNHAGLESITVDP